MKIKKILALTAGLYAFVGLALALAVLTTGGSASAGKHGTAGKSNVAHLYLHEKVPSGEWPIVEDGAWGKMKYNLSGSEFDYVFNGHSLEAGWDYTLIYYPDPWPGTGLKCLGSGVANEYGDVHIMNSLATGDLPMETDDNYLGGAKIWLVKSSDVACGPMWYVVGTWEWLVLGTYKHDLVITSQNPNGTFTAAGGYPAGSSPYTSAGQTPEVITNGQVVEGEISFTTTYSGPYNPGYSVTVTGTINPDGTITGTSPWKWHSTTGNAVMGGKMIGWHPTEYLFEHNLIQFIDTDD